MYLLRILKLVKVSLSIKKKGIHTSIILSRCPLQRKKEELLEFLVCNRALITWDKVFRIQHPGFEQGTCNLHHFWEPQTIFIAMNLI